MKKCETSGCNNIDIEMHQIGPGTNVGLCRKCIREAQAAASQTRMESAHAPPKRRPRPHCTVVSSGETNRSMQGLGRFIGISVDTVGACGISMNLVTIPAGGRAKAHLHEIHETAIYILSGTSEMWYGEKLREHLTAHQGDFVYIPAGMPHLPANPSQSEPCIAVLARTDPNEQESVVLLPHLDEKVV